MRNVEVKVRAGLAALPERLSRHGAHFAASLEQRDVYFNVPQGRLKLRFITILAAPDSDISLGSGARRAELIAYQRPDRARLRTSVYERLAVADGGVLLAALDLVLVRRGEIRKRRQVYLDANVRLHLDEVDGLGEFVEVEAVVDAAHDEAACEAQAAAWIARLGLREAQRESKSYIDLSAGCRPS